MENKFNEGQMVKMKLEDGGYKYNNVIDYYFNEEVGCYLYRMNEPITMPVYREEWLEAATEEEITELNNLNAAGLIGRDKLRWIIVRKPKLIQSCKDPKTIYIEIDDIRWIFRNGEFYGWYKP